MGKMQRNKGARGEREVCKILCEAGIPAERISQLEADGKRKGDLSVASVWRASVKDGSHVPQFVYNARSNKEEFLLMKRDRQKWQVCMDLSFFLRYFT